jgi:hypothetical protein
MRHMQAAASNKLFTDSSQLVLRAMPTNPLSTPYPVILDDLFARIAVEVDARKAAGWLAQTARQAYLLRRPDISEWASERILDLPVSSRIQSVATYYSLQYQNRTLEESRIILTNVIDDAPAGYRERAILELAANYRWSGDLQASAGCCLEAARASKGTDEVTRAKAHMLLAVLRSSNGDHRGALTDLHRLWPVIHSLSPAYPVLYYDYLNSLAVELGELRKFPEAKAAITIALSSQFAPVYPNWSETQTEIEETAAKEPRRPSPTYVVVAPSSMTRRPAKPYGAPPSRSSLSLLRGASAVVSRLRRCDRKRCDVIERIIACVHPRGPPIVSEFRHLSQQCSDPQQSRATRLGRAQARAPSGGMGVVYPQVVVCPCPPDRGQVQRAPRYPRTACCPCRAPPLCIRRRAGFPPSPPALASSTRQRARSALRNGFLAHPNRKRCHGRRDSADLPKWQADGCSRGKFHPSASAGHMFDLRLNMCPWRTL